MASVAKVDRDLPGDLVMWILIVSELAVFGAGLLAFLAVRRVRIPGWQKVLVLLAEVVLGAAVVGLELLAHG